MSTDFRFFFLKKRVAETNAAETNGKRAANPLDRVRLTEPTRTHGGGEGWKKSRFVCARARVYRPRRRRRRSHHRPVRSRWRAKPV